MTLDSNLDYRNYLKEKSLSPFLKGFIWGGAFTLTAAISGMLGATFALKSSLPVTIAPLLDQIQEFTDYGLSSLFLPRLTEPVNILLMGIDKVPNVKEGSPEMFAGRSDTMLLVRFQPEDHSIHLLSIPRDSRVQMPNGNYDKINSANAVGGADLASQVVSQNLGDVKIDHTVRITTNALREFIDVVGGVEVYVPKDLKYKDITQKLNIDLKQGLQTLNGEQAEQFSRFRNDSLGDIGRVQRQQVLLKALREKIQNPMMIIRIPQTMKLLHDYIDTDLTPKQILALVGFCRGLEKNNIKMVLLPGRFSTPAEYRLSYWVISESETSKMMGEYFGLGQNSENIDTNSHTTRNYHQIRIAIQNGTSNSDLPIAVAKYLKYQDFANVYVSSNSAPPTKQTQIIANQGNVKSAEMLQQVLEFSEVDVSATGDIDSDVTIRVGEDAENLLQTFAK